MEISIKSLYEPLDIDIDTGAGPSASPAEVDVTPTSLARLPRCAPPPRTRWAPSRR